MEALGDFFVTCLISLLTAGALLLLAGLMGGR